MKPLIEKLTLTDDTSFVARSHRTPLFEVPWHQHQEHELILITEGAGLSFIGNYVGEFEVGDLFLLGSNLPHTFQKSGDLITSAVVIHFREDFWGQAFLDMPESYSIKKLLKEAGKGLKIASAVREKLSALICSLEHQKGFRRIIDLCECLAVISECPEHLSLSTQEIKELNVKDKQRLDRVIQYTMDNFREPIQLSIVADIAGMSVPAFCNYFKKRTKKTYIDFVNEIRIGYTCKLLMTTQSNILQACYESGFNSVANFNRQFLKIKGVTPSAYRKQLSHLADGLWSTDEENADQPFRTLQQS